MIYIVDLDDTLVSSTILNNDAYNFALEQYGFERLITNKRITREKLNFIDNDCLNNIIQLKQFYFTQKWLPYRVVLNKPLIDKIKLNKKENCYLWTKADKNRVNKIIETCKLSEFFKDIILDDKLNFENSIQKLKQKTHSNQFVIYENNKVFFFNKACQIVDSIKTTLFDINGYLIR